MKAKTPTIERNNFSGTIKKLLLFLMFIVIIPLTFETTTLFAQSEFNSENQKQQVYYDSLLNILGSDSMQGTGYTQYKRWNRYWAPRLSVNYDYNEYQNDLLNYANNYTSPQGNAAGPKWKLIGPNDIPFDGTHAKGTGQIHYIYKDPNDETGNILYACSPVGGLFKSIDNGENWFNAGTDKGLPRCGVSSVVVDSRSATTLYVTTGNGEGYASLKTWQTSIGVWRTNNNGDTWENIGLGEDNNGDNIYHMRKVIEIENSTDSTHLVVTTTEGLYSSRNANKQIPVWDTLIKGEFYDVVVDPGDTNIIFASGSNSTGIYKYDLANNIATMLLDIDTITLPYDTMVIKRPELRRISLNTTVADSTYLFAVFANADYRNTIVYRYSTNSGNWYKFLGTPFLNGYARKLGWAIRPQLNDSSQLQIVGRDDWAYMLLFYNGLSNNDSVKSKSVKHAQGSDSPHDDFHYLMIEDDNKTIWAGTDGGIYKGEFVNDTLINWQAKSKGLSVATIEHIDARQKIVTSGQFDCGSNVYTTDDELNWSVIEKTHGDGFQNIIQNENLYYLSHNDGQIFKYLNGASKPMLMGYFTSCKPPYATLAHGNFSTYYDKIDTILYAAGAKEILRWTFGNNDTSWVEWSNFENQIGCAMSGTWRVAVSLASDGTTHQIYAGAHQEPGDYEHLFKSINGGGAHESKWARVDNTPETGRINSIEITANPDSVLVAIHRKIFSVNTTSPANPSWYDLTYGLDAGNINSIDIDGNVIWIGTERGVYYLEGTSWVDYSSATNLPNCEIKDIKALGRKVYVGTYGRGVWFAGTPDCADVNDYDTLTTDRVIALGIERIKPRNIYIPTGKTLTVYGVLKMGTGCRVIVERGAKLIVDGGTITNLCPDFWQGVEVRGHNNAAQVPANQGWVTLMNGATIEYAKQAVITIKYENNAAYPSYAGGIVQSDSAFFKNNLEDVVFLPYPVSYPTFPDMNNVSYFRNTAFVTDSDFYYFSNQAVTHITLEDVKGVLFENNVFANTADVDLVNDYNRGIGIMSWSAGFIVRNAYGKSGGNIFHDLYYGIKAFAFTNNNELIEIDSNTFNHNRTGCYLGAETNAVVIRNKFKVTPSAGGLADGYSGLYLDACTGYQIEENEFYSNYNPSFHENSYSRSYGLVINNSGPEDNEVYNNYFHNIGYATTAQEINRSKYGTGLTIKCNDYQSNYQDIDVSSFEPGDQYGIKPSQGSNANLPDAPAGNTFSHRNDTTNTHSDYNNACANITYWHHFPNLSGAPYVVPVYSTPFPKINKTMIPNAPSYQKNSACPPSPENRSQVIIRTDIAANKSNEEVYVDSLDLLVDDGNTTTMNLDVSTSIPPETMELRDELLAASPYLSDTVMVNAAEKEDVLPNSIITEVLTANPQSAKSDNVLNALDERDNPPNENQMAAIHANDTVIGHKHSLESKRAYYAGKKAKSVYELARLFMKDTTGLAIHDSIGQALTDVQSTTSRYLQAFCKLNTNDSLGVLNLLNNIPSEFDLDDAEIDYHDYFNDYFDVLLELQAQEKIASEIDSTQKAEVYDIMNNTGGLLHAYTRNLLIYTDGFEYHEPYLFPDTSSNKTAVVKENIYSHLWDEESYFKLYPNPANGYITFEYKLDYGVLKAVVEVVSIDGVHVSTFRLFNRSGIKIIDLRDWQSGTYLLRLIESGKTLQNEKFIKY